MTPKQKANELANKFISKSVFDMTDEELKAERELGKKYALICVDEMLEHAQMIETEYEGYNNPYQYFLQVKLEISLL